MATVSHRRRSSGDGGGARSGSAVAQGSTAALSGNNAGGTGGHAAAPSSSNAANAGPSKRTGSTGTRNRMDANLRMSSKTGKSSENLHALGGGAGGPRHKSSDKLHRMAAISGQGGSSTNLGANKRSKSYSQIMSATDTSGKKKPKKQQQQPTTNSNNRKDEDSHEKNAEAADGEEEDDGWISSSQAGTPGERSKENSPPESSDEEDEGLVMGSKGKRRQAPPSVIEPKVQSNGVSRQEEEKAEGKDEKQDESSKPLKRTDTQITLRGFEPENMRRQDSQRTVADPGEAKPEVVDAGEEDERQHDVRRERGDGERVGRDRKGVLSASPAHLRRPTNHERTDSEETLALRDRAEDAQTANQLARLSQLITSSDQPDSGALVPSVISTSPTQGFSPAPSPASLSQVQRPASLRASRSSSLFPRESLGLAPKLSTHNALTGALGSLYEGRQNEGGRPMSLTIEAEHFPNSSSEPFDLAGAGHDRREARRKASISSTRSTINIGSSSPSMANVSHAKANAEARQASTHSPAMQAIQRASGSGFPTSHSNASSLSSFQQLGPGSGSGHERRRTQSTQSLTAADAAKLAAKLRMAQGSGGSFDEGGPGGSSASGGAGSQGRAAGYKTGASVRDQALNAAIARYNKPVISKFAKDQVGLESEPMEIGVGYSSIYHDNFTRASTPVTGSDDDDDDDGGQSGKFIEGRKKGTRQAGNKLGNKKKEDQRQQLHQHRHKHIRYVMDFGLGGPALEKSSTTDALLSPSLENDEFEASWAPALTQAAGLGARSLRSTRSARQGRKAGHHVVDENGDPISPSALSSNEPMAMQAEGFASAAAATGNIAVNGPNAMPLHFSHGLTTTSDEPFPLDLSDIAGSRSLLEGGDEATGAQSGPYHGHAGVEGRFLDSKTLRAIAMTAQALAVYRSHIVTRRFSDPMRESLERVGRASGHLPLHITPSTPTEKSNSTIFANGVTHRGRWGSFTTPSSLAATGGAPARSPLRETSQQRRRPDFPRSNTMGGPQSNAHNNGNDGGSASGALSSLTEQTESPLTALKRVWSGGAGLQKSGGLSSLSRTRTTDDR